MKKIYTIVLILLTTFGISQNVAINSTGAAPAASAMLDITSTNTGMLIPRVALTANNVAGPITAPATSLLVYNTATSGTSPNDVVPGYYFWDGTRWMRLISGVYLNSSQISSIGKFYTTFSWSGTWTNGTTLTFVTTDPNMLCGATASAAFVSFDCTNSNALMAGFTIRNVKCNAGSFAVTITNNTGSTFGPGGIPATYVAFY